VTQLNTVRRLLEEAGPHGEEVHDLIYDHGITRAAAVIHTLRKDFNLPIRNVEDEPGKLARYVLDDVPPRRVPRPPETNEPPPPAVPLALPCGCVRAADGRQWSQRCVRHL
jgi:hypothetical protein